MEQLSTPYLTFCLVNGFRDLSLSALAQVEKHVMITEVLLKTPPDLVPPNLRSELKLNAFMK